MTVKKNIKKLFKCLLVKFLVSNFSVNFCPSLPRS